VTKIDTTVLDARVFRPRIHEAILKIARFAGTEAAVKPILDLQEPPEGQGPWSYLMRVLEETGDALGSPKLEAASQHEWFPFFYDGRLDEYGGGDLHPIDLEHYPEEAQEALQQGVFVGGDGADVICLWTTEEGVARVCHAHPESFSVLAEDPVAFAEKFAAKLEATSVAA
jgi:hypothetical protein